MADNKTKTKIVIYDLSPDEGRIIDYYRAIKRFLRPGNFTIHFDENGIIRKRDFQGYNYEDEHLSEMNEKLSTDDSQPVENSEP